MIWRLQRIGIPRVFIKARAGEIKNFTGIDDPYEAPNDAEIHLVSDKMSLSEEVNFIMDYLEHLSVLS